MANVNPPSECNPLGVVGRLSGGRGGRMPCVGATLCTFPAFSLVPKNAMVDNLHGEPHVLTLRSWVSRCVSTLVRSSQRCKQHQTDESLLLGSRNKG